MATVELFRFNSLEDPITTAVRCWVLLCEVRNYKEHTSGYSWDAIGDLPTILYKSQLFSKENIINYLRYTYDLDTDLSLEEKETSKLIEETCYGALHPCTLYAQWMNSETSKDFYDNKCSFLQRLITSPFNKLRYNLDKAHIQGYLAKQHCIVSEEQALKRAGQVYETLSTMLGEKAFFMSKFDRREMPRSADVVVYAYLHYQMRAIPQHEMVALLMKKFENLTRFVGRFESAIRLKVRAKMSSIEKFDFITDPVGPGDRDFATEYFSTKVYGQALETGSDRWNQLVYKLGGDEPSLRTNPQDLTKTRSYYIGLAFCALLFMSFRANS